MVKKFISLVLSIIMVVSICGIDAIAFNPDKKDKEIEISKIEKSEYNKIKEKAIKGNKAISENEFDKIIKKAKKNNDIEGMKNELGKYAVSTEYYYPEDTNLFKASANKTGDKRIRIDRYYQYASKTDSTYTVSDGTKINASVILGFLSFLPSPYGTGFGVVSILQSMTGMSNYEMLSTKNIYERSYYDAVVTTKYAEVYIEDGWDVAAYSQLKQYDGYYLVSGYKNGTQHFVKSKSVGTLRMDVGKYYYDNTKLLSYATIGHGGIHFLYDYSSGYKAYYYPKL